MHQGKIRHHVIPKYKYVIKPVTITVGNQDFVFVAVDWVYGIYFCDSTVLLSLVKTYHW